MCHVRDLFYHCTSPKCRNTTKKTIQMSPCHNVFGDGGDKTRCLGDWYTIPDTVDESKKQCGRCSEKYERGQLTKVEIEEAQKANGGKPKGPAVPGSSSKAGGATNTGGSGNTGGSVVGKATH